MTSMAKEQAADEGGDRGEARRARRAGPAGASAAGRGQTWPANSARVAPGERFAASECPRPAADVVGMVCSFPTTSPIEKPYNPPYGPPRLALDTFREGVRAGCTADRVQLERKLTWMLTAKAPGHEDVRPSCPEGEEDPVLVYQGFCQSGCALKRSCSGRARRRSTTWRRVHVTEVSSFQPGRIRVG